MPAVPRVLPDLCHHGTFPGVVPAHMLVPTNEVEEAGFHFYQNALWWLKAIPHTIFHQLKEPYSEDFRPTQIAKVNIQDLE